jgi:hypothetical protein
MGFSETFGSLAHNLILKFTEEVGKSTFKSIVSVGYNAETGTVTPVYEADELIYVAFTNLDETIESVSATTSEEPNIVSNVRKAYIAGSDTAFIPKKDDLILAADNGLTYKIDDLTTDMYSACYTLTISLVP